MQSFYHSNFSALLAVKGYSPKVMNRKKFMVGLCDGKGTLIVIEADEALVTTGRMLKFKSGFWRTETAAFQLDAWDWFREMTEGENAPNT